MDDDYRPPILASIFRGIGWIDMLVGVVLLAVAAIETASKDRDMSGLTLFAAFLPSLSAFATALIVFGVAQVIDHIGQIAWYAALIHEQLVRGENVTTRRAGDLFTLLKAVAGNTKKMAAGEPKVSDADRYYFADESGQAAGPASLAELKSMADAGTISAETLVCREGNDDWLPLAARVTL